MGLGRGKLGLLLDWHFLLVLLPQLDLWHAVLLVFVGDGRFHRFDGVGALALLAAVLVVLHGVRLWLALLLLFI